MSEVYLKQETIEAMEENWRLQNEAVELLGVVVAEWKSDPQSVQCFDLRIVQRAKEVVERLEVLQKTLPRTRR